MLELRTTLATKSGTEYQQELTTTYHLQSCHFIAKLSVTGKNNNPACNCKNKSKVEKGKYRGEKIWWWFDCEVYHSTCQNISKFVI